MTGPRAAARWIVGASLLMPGLLILHPSEIPAAVKETKAAPARRVASREQPPKPKTAAAKKPKTVTPAPKVDATDRCVHVVRRGESIGRVASRYRIPPHTIVTANNLGPAATLKVGQRLALPGCSKRAPGPAVAAAPPPAVELEDGLLLARVGPARVPTRLYVAVPEFGGDAIEFAWPVDGTIASNFGRRRAGWHAGIDIKAELGTPVLAAASGTVIFSGWAASYGRMIKLQHPNGFITVYAHNLENLVQVGDEVATGAMIATVGRSGRASAEHLHFEIRRDGMAFNPIYLLESRDSVPILVGTATEPLGEETDDDVRE